MRSIRVYFDNNTNITTNINGTNAEILDYYATGKEFNLGDGAGGDCMAKVRLVEFLDTEFSRADYMAKKCTHEEFWGQYVNQHVTDVVLRRIGREKIQASKCPHFNDIPLSCWDALAGAVQSHVATMNVKSGMYKTRSASLSDCVCTLKAAAEKIRAAKKC
jgi:hypothetical protein